jgi:hypothetical protein
MCGVLIFGGVVKERVFNYDVKGMGPCKSSRFSVQKMFLRRPCSYSV